ncbi:hypothetical protein [Geodermatophilus ruber]|uniref:Uncharacterized protein n=1 Tax=Geodermatophilus ruber TaxID=504800 RepID=A0A1I4AJR4_9ACTN|nr:hypothetical protein [Geodermatophilus ruber]SFK56420.1 hypothetical protein SAMN04488085_102258 [Geodermatophilus ruber]
MHFTAGRDVLVELIDPNTGAQVDWVEGAEGELLYTTFSREATPVLRERLRVRVVVEVHPAGIIPIGVYKNALMSVPEQSKEAWSSRN